MDHSPRGHKESDRTEQLSIYVCEGYSIVGTWTLKSYWLGSGVSFIVY